MCAVREYKYTYACVGCENTHILLRISSCGRQMCSLGEYACGGCESIQMQVCICRVRKYKCKYARIGCEHTNMHLEGASVYI